METENQALKWSPIAGCIRGNGRHVLLYLMLYSLLVATLPRFSGLVDISHFFTNWALAISEYGLGYIYSHSDCNLPPLYLYLLKLYTITQSSPEAIVDRILQLKAYSLVFDFLGAIALLLLLPKKDRDPVLPLFLLCNIAFIYNSFIWGQIDAIYAALLFFAFIALIKARVYLGTVFYCLALCFKIQAIAVLPVFLIVFVVQAPKRMTAYVKAILGAFLTAFVVCLPFFKTGEVGAVIQVVFASVDYYPWVSVNAFNIWEFLIQGNPKDVSDQAQLFGAITYKRLGLLMFASALTVILLPLARISVRKLSRGERYGLTEVPLIVLTTAMVPIMFFYFNTQMHERYSHPAMLFLGAYAIIAKRPHLYILFCVAYLMNMEAICHFWTEPLRSAGGTGIQPITLESTAGVLQSLLDDHRRIVSAIYLSVIALGVKEVYGLGSKHDLGKTRRGEVFLSASLPSKG